MRALVGACAAYRGVATARRLPLPAIAGTLLALVESSSAASYVVTNTNYSVTGAYGNTADIGSLRYAMIQSNAGSITSAVWTCQIKGCVPRCTANVMAQGFARNRVFFCGTATHGLFHSGAVFRGTEGAISNRGYVLRLSSRTFPRMRLVQG